VHLQDPYRTLLGQLIEFGGGPERSRDDVRTVRGQAPGDRQPDAAAGPGDDGGPPGQSQVHRVSSSGRGCGYTLTRRVEALGVSPWIGDHRLGAGTSRTHDSMSA